MTLTNIKGWTLPAVTEYMTTKGLGLWDVQEKGGLLEATFNRTACGVTVEEVQVLFGRNNRAGLVRVWEADLQD